MNTKLCRNPNFLLYSNWKENFEFSALLLQFFYDWTHRWTCLFVMSRCGLPIATHLLTGSQPASPLEPFSPVMTQRSVPTKQDSSSGFERCCNLQDGTLNSGEPTTLVETADVVLRRFQRKEEGGRLLRLKFLRQGLVLSKIYQSSEGWMRVVALNVIKCPFFPVPFFVNGCYLNCSTFSVEIYSSEERSTVAIFFDIKLAHHVE